MTRRTSESGFTLLEVLVASMLLAMLITILTMVFNSSSIAWTMGKAGVADMATVRNNLSAADRAAARASLLAMASRISASTSVMPTMMKCLSSSISETFMLT